MERKLLSLPSFFVLLLVAGIAFLAAPVVDVHAALTGTNTITVARTTPATGNATSGNAVFTITFATHAVKVTGETVGGSAIAAGDGFGPEDLEVKHVQSATSPQGDGSTKIYGASGYTFAKTDSQPAAGVQTVAGSGVVFTVTIPVPTGHNGDLTVSVKAAGTGVAFEEVVTDTMTYAGATAISATIPYVAYNPKPTVTVHPLPANTALTASTPDDDDLLASAGAEAFLVRFVIKDTTGTGANDGFTATPTFTSANIDISGGTIEEVGRVVPDSAATANNNEYWVHAYIKATPPTATTTVTSVIIGVKAGAVTDKGGATSAAVPITKTDDELADGAAEVMVDTVPPHVEISDPPELTPSGPHSATNRLTSIKVTFTVKDSAAMTAESTPKTALSSDDGGDAIVKAELTVTGGTIDGEVTAKASTFNAVFEAMITPNADAEKVTIGVKANAVRDGALNGNQATQTPVEVVTGFKPGVVTTGSGERKVLSGERRGFGFTLPAMPPPTAANGSDRFVVLAKAPNNSADNGLSVPASRFVDIDDELWQDLADFLAYDGGTIHLIGPGNTAKNTLVISEMMWGGDDYLSDSTKSQWIELYNATTTKGTATGAITSGPWEIVFHAGTGLVSDPANLSDSFSNRELGNAHWDIPNVSGGKYGQGGRTQTSPGVAGSLRDLVSMRRKIDYAKVEKIDHKDDATENRAEQVKGIPNGALAGSWEASTSRVNMSGTRKGTPGARHIVVVGTSGISKSVVFNEIANRSDKKFDWIELYNPGSADVKINNWVLSKVTAVNKDEKLFKFESDENIVVPAKGFLLVVNEDPSETALAAGENVDNPNSRANGLPTKIYINSGLDIPKEKFLLILRTEEKLGSHEKIVDIGGHLAGLTLEHVDSATELWPLKAWKKIKEDDLVENNDKTWVRDKGKDLYHGDAWKSDGGVTGLGIDRNPDSSDGPTSGTPGFDNGAVKDKVKDLTASDPVVISEIMFGSGNNRVPQWIELYNPSKTQAVKLNAWRLEVQNTIDASESLNVEFNYTLILPDVRIQPNQTVLIVSSSTGDSTRDRFPKDRIINIWSTRSLRDITEMSSPRDAILSSVGFHMKLSDPEKRVVDEVGNIDGNRRTADAPAWDLPGGNLEEGGPRASMIRRKGTFGDGTEADAWISAAITDGAQKVGINELYYGAEDDVGTPGYRAGGPLPVQLSSFYSKRNDAGAVIITWSTESELDNAGFNILRSLSRVGEFTRINAQLIPGAGTTGEKNTYTWTDTSARPNVVYYYQIEDVSLDGEHRTLRTTRLRGYVGAAGKATTIWGELKSRD